MRKQVEVQQRVGLFGKARSKAMMKRLMLFGVTAALLLSVHALTVREPVFAHGIQCYVNGRWFNGRTFDAKTFYSIEGIFRTDYRGKVDQTIDLQGRYIIPPFAEAHNHHFGDSQDIKGQIKTYLSRGIFYAKNTNSTQKLTAPLRQFVNIPESLDVVYSYGGLTASGGHPIQIYDAMAAQITGWTAKAMENEAYYIVDSEQDLERKWPQILAGKPDFIKTYLEYSEEYTKRKNDPVYYGKRGLDPKLLPAIVRRAHASGLRVAVHVNSAADYRHALQARVDEITHLPLEKITAADAQETARLGTVVVTTTLSHRPTGHIKDLDDVNRHNLQLLHRTGVRLAVGTDDNNRTVIDEAANLERLRVFDNLTLIKLLVEATPQSIYPKRKIGRLEKLFEASFLALDGNPLEDFTNLRKVAMRVKKGHLIEIAPEPPKKPAIIDTIAHTLMRDGVAQSIAEYRRLRKDRPEEFDFSEGQLNQFGYQLLNHGRLDDAIEIFKLNVEMFPRGFNTYDSLGEAYLKAGNRELAVKNYQKSLELNPHNTNATQKLNTIQ
jgi:tetratricopeptide (TPR) repeat protein